MRKPIIFVCLITAAVIFIAGAAGPALAQEVQDEIKAIEVEGNNRIAEEEILAVVDSAAGDKFDREKIKQEMQAIYELGYFQDVRVSLENYQGGLKVIFRVVENPVIEEINITGNEVYDREQIIDWLNIETGTIMKMDRLNEGIKNVQQKYQDDGYILIRFTDVNFSDEGVLNLEINPGYLNRVLIKGNEKTKDFVIRRELDFEKGQIFNINDVREAYSDLYRLNYFEEINPELERIEDGDNRVNLVINLTESKTGTFRLGGGYSTRDGWIGYVRVQERNLFGNGQSLGFDWEFGEVNNYSLNFREPWIFGYPTSFGISLYNQQTDRTTEEEEYTERRRGGSISLGHALTEQWRGTVKYKVEDYWKDIKDNGVTDYDIRSLTFEVDRDTTNHPFNPTAGGMDIASIEYAGDFLGGDYQFTKYNLDVRRFYPGFKSEHAWALRLKSGIGQGDIPPSEEFHLGGSQSLRGYEAYSFNGKDMLLMNLEYRFPIVERFTGVLFADGGNTWDQPEEISLSDIHHSLGLGVRINLPIGQIRLDYGWNEEGTGMPHFSIGNTF